MTRKKDEEAQRAAATCEGKALLARMHGKGWKLRVWENAGWWYAVENGALSISPTGLEYEGRCRYSTLLGRDGLSGEMFWTENKSYTDPNAAVRRQIKIARKFISEITAVVDKVERATGAK